MSMRAEVVQPHLFAIFKAQRFDLDQLYVRLQISQGRHQGEFANRI
jgi:hypothetical protein